MKLFKTILVSLCFVLLFQSCSGPKTSDGGETTDENGEAGEIGVSFDYGDENDGKDIDAVNTISNHMPESARPATDSGLDTDFNFLFNLYDNATGEASAMDSYILGTMKPYLRNGDVINVMIANNANSLSDSKLSNFIVRMRALMKGLEGIDVKFTAYTAGKEHMDQLIAKLETAPDVLEQMYGLVFGYEPDYLPEWQRTMGGGSNYVPSVADATAIIDEVALKIRAVGLKAAAGPSGRGLSLTDWPGFRTWGAQGAYGQFGQKLDFMILQSQGRLSADATVNMPAGQGATNNIPVGSVHYTYTYTTGSKGNTDIPEYTRAINMLLDMMKRYPSGCDYYPQITITAKDPDGLNRPGIGNGNGAQPELCVNAMKLIKEKGFPGLSFWYSPDAHENLLTCVKTMREPIQ